MRWTKVEPQEWEVGRKGQEKRRLRPRLSDPSYCELRVLADEVTGFVQDFALDGATVVDYGCGDRPYEPLFPSNCFYVGVDVLPNPSADVVSDQRLGLPLAEGVADVVISTQTLHHVENYDLYLSECLRILKPGGTLLLTTHGTYTCGGSFDYWRFTPTGLAIVVERNGFLVERMKPLLGIFGAATFLRQSMYNRILRRKRLTLLAHLVTTVMNLSVRLTERLTARYIWVAPVIVSCIARKPSSEELR